MCNNPLRDNDIIISFKSCNEILPQNSLKCKSEIVIAGLPITFNNTAASLIKHGHARQVDESEGLDLLQLAYENHLVQFGENIRNSVNFICNCCGCCCEAMIAARRFAVLNPIHTTNFIPFVNSEQCNGCGKCVNICPVEAIKREKAA